MVLPRLTKRCCVRVAAGRLSGIVIEAMGAGRHVSAPGHGERGKLRQAATAGGAGPACLRPLRHAFQCFPCFQSVVVSAPVRAVGRR